MSRGKFLDRHRFRGLGALHLGHSAPVRGADQVGGWNPLPRGIRGLGANQTKALVGRLAGEL